MNRFLLGAAILGCLGPSVAAQSVTIAPDRDNTLYESMGGELSNGAGTRIFAGRTIGAANRRTVVSFDIAGSVPAGAVITGATFEATEVQNQFGGSALFSLHSLTRDWGEGTAAALGGQGGGQAPGAGDATWDSAMFGSVLWTSAGGDFNATASDSATWALDGSSTQSISGAGLAADVQGWLDNPASNYGWLLKSDELMGGTVSAFGSRESVTPPQLTITYAMPVTVTIAPSRDNSLYEVGVGEASNGGGTRLFVGRTVGGVNRRTILGFDVSGSVPSGSTITGADLEITEVFNNFGGSAPFSVHEVSQDWGEGTSVAGGGQGAGGPVAAGDVTWLSNFFGSSTWTNPGGDFDAVASATQSITFGGGGARTINSTAGLVADVQGWLDSPASNYGWVIRTDEAMGGAVSAYGSRESADAPQLTITYLPPAGPVAQNIPFGAGCMAPSGGSVLTLSGVGVPSLGNSGYTLQISGGAPTTLLEAISLGFGASPIPIPLPTGGGCNFLLDPSLLAGTLTPNASRAVNLPIPNMPGLAGVSIFFQAIQIDGTLFILGSNGLEAAIGN